MDAALILLFVVSTEAPHKADLVRGSLRHSYQLTSWSKTSQFAFGLDKFYNTCQSFNTVEEMIVMMTISLICESARSSYHHRMQQLMQNIPDGKFSSFWRRCWIWLSKAAALQS